ncbi:shikimate kinase [Stygiolobus caldivivus]|uniref:Shikimate kinase n=1 Tax=Stygiolobus caldivivus TaxID=2824673 RepID=A0A8D5U566_9CREN|nr:shikimate kinase [Stygiolobus caldivivus]BCU69462.1 shikimate kinase [Stygiolobus caldivivus]
MQAYAGVSIVNALPSWYGSSMAINLTLDVNIKQSSVCQGYSPLIDQIISYFRDNYSIPCIDVDISSNIPQKSGLKSSSAVSTALIAEIIKNFKLPIRLSEVPKLSAILSLKAGVSYTGALDDATSSFFGGVSFTYNKEFKIIEIREPPFDISVLLIAKGDRGVKINMNYMRKFELLFKEIFALARRDMITAMKLNGITIGTILGYDLTLINEMLKRGALASGISGNGPSIFSVTKKGDEGPILDFLEKNGEKPLLLEPVKLCEQRLKDQ